MTYSDVSFHIYIYVQYRLLYASLPSVFSTLIPAPISRILRLPHLVDHFCFQLLSFTYYLHQSYPLSPNYFYYAVSIILFFLHISWRSLFSTNKLPCYFIVEVYVPFILVSCRGVKLTTHPHLVPRSKNAWNYTSTPPVRLHGVVLSWAQGQLWFHVFEMFSRYLSSITH
jgi:hypothetical protein